MDYDATCPNCGESFCVMEMTYNVDGIKKCKSCVKLSDITTPFFVQHIPNYVDGATSKVITFNTKEELFEKLDKHDDKMIYVYDNNTLMIQSLEKSFWWVKGFINNFNLNNLGIAKFNHKVYNDDKIVNKARVIGWLKSSGCDMDYLYDALSKLRKE